ncbi:hypothetical protein ACFQY4_01635 [Catellatospora bangladeshensis]|uniref:hypothetical protein n=1 Tax=Catellatospora bangladeshensis TaxID=310355 RepID=UPI00360A7FB8
MGTLGNGLPDLPPEWGEVVIPDDPAELAEEAERVRAELRREAKAVRRAARRAKWRRRLRLPERIDDPDQPSLVLPLVVLGIAVVITLLSLLLIAWPSLTRTTPTPPQPGPPVQPAVSAPAVISPSTPPTTGSPAAPTGAQTSPADRLRTPPAKIRASGPNAVRHAEGAPAPPH